MNNLKNLVLVSKALYSIDGLKVRIKDSGVASSICSEREVEVETVTIDSLGRFSLVKMDIEGAEGKVIREDSELLNYVRAMTVEFDGKENLANVPKVLTHRDFAVREMRRTDVIKNALRNVLSHPIDFFRAEAKTKVFINALRGFYKVPALEEEESVRIIYVSRVK